MMQRTRPRSLEELDVRMDKFSTDKSVELAKAFQPRPSDIFVMTPAKCGTTWVQQIVHGLRTGGSMDFEEISCAVPWIETAHDMGIDLNAPQVAEPRAFKTHFNWHDVPKGGRYIIVIRHPYDVALSHYRFFENMFFEPGSISLEEYVRGRVIPRAIYWKHIASWWEHRKDPNVLALCYEDMHSRHSDAVIRVAKFMGVQFEPSLIDLIVKQSTFKFMKAHETQFDDHVLRALFEETMQLPPDGQFTKVSTGRIGDSKLELDESLRSDLDEVWRKEVAGLLGVETYQDLCEQLSHW